MKIQRLAKTSSPLLLRTAAVPIQHMTKVCIYKFAWAPPKCLMIHCFPFCCLCKFSVILAIIILIMAEMIQHNLILQASTSKRLSLVMQDPFLTTHIRDLPNFQMSVRYWKEFVILLCWTRIWSFGKGENWKQKGLVVFPCCSDQYVTRIIWLNDIQSRTSYLTGDSVKKRWFWHVETSTPWGPHIWKRS